MLKYRCACSTLSFRRGFLTVYSPHCTLALYVTECYSVSRKNTHAYMRADTRAANERWIDYELRQVECHSHPVFGERVSTPVRHLRRLMMFARITSTAVIYVTRSPNPTCGNLVWHFFFCVYQKRVPTWVTRGWICLSIRAHARLVTIFFYYFSSVYLRYLRYSIFVSSCWNFRCINATIFDISIIYLISVITTLSFAFLSHHKCTFYIIFSYFLFFSIFFIFFIFCCISLVKAMIFLLVYFNIIFLY